MNFYTFNYNKEALKAELSSSFSLCWPIILTNLAQTAMVTINLSLMGWMNVETLAAGALGTNLFYFFMVFGSALLTAVSPLIAVEIGKNKYSVREVRRSIRQGFWTVIALIIPIWIILWNGEKIFLGMGKNSEISAVAGHYTFVLMWSLAPLFGYMILRSFLATLEKPVWALFFGLAAIPIDFIVAWSLMFGKLGMPQLGLTGIGIAIFIADSFMFLGLLCVVLRHRIFRRYHLFGYFFLPDWKRFRSLWRIGLPIALTSTFEVSVFNISAFSMEEFGTSQMAAYTVAIQIASVTFMVPFGIAQAATIRVGRAKGAGDRLGVLRAGWTCLTLGVTFMALMACVMMIAPTVLIGIFMDIQLPENAAAIMYAKRFLLLAALFQIADGAQTVSSGMLRGLHDTRIPMLIAAFGYWGIAVPVGLGLAFLTPLEGVGLWIGLAVGLFIVAILMVIRWVHQSQKSL